ncbi:peptidyl-tRNA hydrolase, partial [Polychaeton citri CBS 116435]
VPLFICSLGNPGPAYADTLHSAGHTVLTRLAAYLNCSPFTRERAWDKALVTRAPDNGDGADWTLYQSPTYMNVCGKPIRNAYRSWLSGMSGGEGRLVVLHDELEKPLGKVSVRGVEGKGTSAKGHNGLKSMMQVFGPGGVEFVRIGVGIGRPEGRGSKEVGDYVLRKMSPGEKKRVEGCVDEVVDLLRRLERG